MTYQEYYKNLSLPPIPNNEHKFQRYQNTELQVELHNVIAEIECVNLQERIKKITDRVIQDYMEKHNSLIDTLKDLESSNIKLEHQYQTQSLHYQKALKEIDLYRSRCNRLIRCSSLECSIPANPSSARSLGCSSTPTSPIDDFLDPTPSKENLFSDNDDEFDISSILFTPIDSLVASESSLMPLEPLQKSTRNNENAGNKHIKDDTDILKFACNDGFWNTIAQGKSNKPEIDKLVSNYLRRGGDPNVAKSSDTVNNVKEGYSLVHALVATRNTASLRRVLQAGAKPNVFPLTDNAEDQITPLVLAAKFGHLNSIRALVEKSDGDLLNSIGPSGESVLHAAVRSNAKDIVDYVLKRTHNKLLEKTDRAGATPLHYACINGRAHFVTLFVEDCQVKIDPLDNKGETPLHYAVRHKQLKVIMTLIELGASPNSCILKQVPTPLDLAKSCGLASIADYLKQVGAKTTKEIEKGSSTATAYNSSTLSGESSGSSDLNPSNKSIKQYLHMKTTQILKGK
ncbi:hypothetical protein G6F43_002783 [Rhizopus delemar]|nr:hypothetical protein G6F43_002783 [Rhizopus delemar]